MPTVDKDDLYCILICVGIGFVIGWVVGDLIAYVTMPGEYWERYNYETMPMAVVWRYFWWPAVWICPLIGLVVGIVLSLSE